jgi:Mlc titration factor MtfA (ptsG expression regulator)
MESTPVKHHFGFRKWIILFVLLLAAVPALIVLHQIVWAKLTGILVVVLTAVAIRRWLFQATKAKNKPGKIALNTNDRFWFSEHIPFYNRLSRADKKCFEDRVGLFLADVIITEVGQEVPGRETCLYVACSAVIAFWGLPYWNYGRLSEVLVYPANFEDDHTIAESGVIQGQVFHGGLMDTTMILSLPALIHGFANETDKRNVGIHEFAHLIDKADGSFDGIPEGMEEADKGPWIRLCEQEMEHILDGKSDINSYGATNISEFFAVIVEYYKEQPEILEKKHPEIYAILNRLFHKTA